MATLAKNKKAFADYEILETYEAGLKLFGSEVKSIRSGRANLKGSFVDSDSSGEMWVNEMHVSPYKFAHDRVLNPTRKRKLILHKREIEKINAVIRQKGVACIPLELYLKGGLIKIKIALVRGKKKYDRRAELKKRAQNLEVARALKKHVR
ncbi:SsrA-binding protein SmpB [bacterium]|nr:SsrA-binding protein SmpB [bacterium]